MSCVNVLDLIGLRARSKSVPVGFGSRDGGRIIHRQSFHFDTEDTIHTDGGRFDKDVDVSNAAAPPRRCLSRCGGLDGRLATSRRPAVSARDRHTISLARSATSARGGATSAPRCALGAALR